MTGPTFALIVCGVIGGLFLLLGLLFAAATLLSRDKKEKAVEAEADTSFFTAAETPKLAAAARTRGPVASDYTDLTDLPGESRSRGTNEISKPLSHEEIFGSLLDDEADVKDRA